MKARMWLVVAAVCAVATGSGAKAGQGTVRLAEAWSLEGFKNPESVVFDARAGVFYVSNVNGGATEKDGNGFISRVSADGTMLNAVWADGLDAPKGLAIRDGKLYAADIGMLAEIGLDTGKISGRFYAPFAKFLNDVTVDEAGNVYVSDMFDDTIYILVSGTLRPLLKDPALESPNGLLAEKSRIVVGSWGIIVQGFETKVPGRLVALSLVDGTVTPLGEGPPIGNLDGVEPDGVGGYFVTDWMAGRLFDVSDTGVATKLLDLGQGSADLAFVAERKLLVIPMMNDGRLVAYHVGRD